jgi:Ser/Thr protein kinase RdoA (MazF antagonist)
VPDGGGDEVVAAVAALAGPGREVLSPGDTCPDNVLLTPAGPMFVDLEGTDVKPIAFDAAYALLPFATCWCVYAQPPGLTDAMLASFTEGVRARAPELITPGWEREVVTASTVWVLWMSSVLLNHTADPERRMGPREAPALTMRQLVQLRLDWVSQRAADVLPVTAALAADAGAALRAGWGELPVPVYPAWDGCC